MLAATTGHYFEPRFSSALGVLSALLRFVHGTGGLGVGMLPLSMSKLSLESNL